MEPSETVHVLIIDDEKSIQRVLATALTREGFVVSVERDGEWGIRAVQKKRFDVIILDLLLPAMSGYQTLAKIRALPLGGDVPVVLISGVYKSSEHQNDAVNKHGAFAMLEKPIDLHLLRATLQRALGKSYPSGAPPQPPPPPIDDDEDTGRMRADAVQRQEAETVERELRQSRAKHSVLSARGDFSVKSFPDLLAEIYRWRSTGALLVSREKAKKNRLLPRWPARAGEIKRVE